MRRQLSRLARSEDRILLLDAKTLPAAQAPIVEVRSALPTIKAITHRAAARHLGDATLLHAWGLSAGKRAVALAQPKSKQTQSLRVIVSLPGANVAGIPADLPWRISGSKFDVTVPTVTDRDALVAAGADPKRVHHLAPLGRPTQLDQTRIAELRDHFATHSQQLCMVVGELTRRSGAREAAWVHAMISRIRPNVRLIFTKTGPQRRTIKAFLHNNDNDDMASILDLAMPVTDLLAAADVLLLLDQGANTVGDFADALAAGKPIIATNLPSFVDLSNQGEAAMLSERGDIRQAASNLLRLLDDQDTLRESLSEAALRAAKPCSNTAVRATLDTLYQPTC
jgi:hypothetical protein